MKANRLLFSAVIALLLGAAAYLEFQQLRYSLFSMGEAMTPIGLLLGSYLLTTVVGILALGVACLGSLTGKRAFAVVGLAGGLLVLPMIVLFGWGNIHADFVNSRMMQISPRQWTEDVIPLPLILIALWMCWLRIRGHGEHERKAS